MAEQSKDTQLNEEELQEINLHKYFLSQKTGYDVGWECACVDWLSNHAPKWRLARMNKEIGAQMEEIVKHKWSLSQKCGYDVGIQFAAMDWICKYAKEWRRWWEQEGKKKELKNEN